MARLSDWMGPWPEWGEEGMAGLPPLDPPLELPLPPARGWGAL